MTTFFLGNPIIAELLANPAAFKERGRAYELLEEYFAGLSIDTLRPLLAHSDILVRHAAVFVASELGQQSCTLLDDVIALLKDEDRYLSYHALEVVAVCADGAQVDRFVHIPRALESHDEVIRTLAMRLLRRADVAQLVAGHRLAASIRLNAGSHKDGLLMLADWQSHQPDDVRRMLLDEDPVARRYGVVGAKHMRYTCPELLQLAADLPDSDVRRFATEAD
jgi:HEAT repeat protein